MLNSRGGVYWPRVPQFGHGSRTARPRVGLLRVAALAGCELLRELVGAEPLVARRALDQRVGERADVAGRDPHLARQDHRRVQADDVLAAGDHGAPPLPLDVVLELHAQRAVVPGRARTAVDLARGEDESAALGERDDGLDRGRGRLAGHWSDSWMGGARGVPPGLPNGHPRLPPTPPSPNLGSAPGPLPSHHRSRARNAFPLVPCRAREPGYGRGTLNPGPPRLVAGWRVRRNRRYRATSIARRSARPAGRAARPHAVSPGTRRSPGPGRDAGGGRT